MKRKMFFKITSFIVISLFFLSCSENSVDDINLRIEKIKLNENIRINSITFRSPEEGILCGGIKNTLGCIYKTIDAGKTWQLKFKSDSLSVRDVFYLNDSTVFACGDSMLLLISHNAGDSWQIYKFENFPYDEYRVPYKNIHAFSDKKVILVGGEHFEKGLISKTETGNYPWTHVSHDNEFNSLCFVSDYVGFICGYGVVMVTEDGGNNFEYLDLGNGDFMDIEYSNGDVYVLENSGTIHLSSDLGYTWFIDSNFWKDGFYDMAFGRDFVVVVGTNSKAYLKYFSQGQWKKIAGLDSDNFYSCYINSENVIYIGSDKGNLYILNRKRLN